MVALCKVMRQTHTVLLLVVTVVRVQISLNSLALDIEIVRELAFISLRACTGLVEGAQDGLWVDTERNLLLDLDGFKQVDELLLLGLLSALAIDDCLLFTVLLNLLASNAVQVMLFLLIKSCVGSQSQCPD